jgi:uncharacterized delta-60 repeat protein
VAGGWTSFALAVAPDGRIVVAGATAPNFGSSYDPFVARFNTNGNIDYTFGSYGASWLVLGSGADQASDVALQPDGRIVVAGTVDSNGTVFPGDFDLVALRFEGAPAACGNGVVEPGEHATTPPSPATLRGACRSDGLRGLARRCVRLACGKRTSPDSRRATTAPRRATAATAPVASRTAGRTKPVDVPVCGDSRIVGAEQCDDGNGSSGDCCSASCQSEPNGGPCTADTSQCSFDLCSAHGYCTHEFVPDPSCGQPALPGRGTLRILDLPGDTHDRAELKITKGPAVAKPAFGIPPLAAPTYTLCVYDEPAGVPRILLDATAAGDGDCSDGTCWQEKPWGWKQKGGAGLPNGVVAVKLREGIAGKSKVIMQAKGQHLATPSLPLSTDGAVTAQIRTSDGQCFGGVFPAAATNTSSLYRAKSQ